MKLLDDDTITGYKVLIIILSTFAQIIFILSDGLQSYTTYLSYIVGFPILFIMLLWCDLSLGDIIIQRHLRPFSLTSTKNLLIRLDYILFKKKYWIYIVIFYSSILLASDVGIERKILYTVWSILQTVLTLSAMIILNDFLERKELSRHLLTIPAFFILFDSFLPDTDKIYLLVNPFFVGCAAVGFLNISNFPVTLLTSGLAFVLLSSLLILINSVSNTA